MLHVTFKKAINIAHEAPMRTTITHTRMIIQGVPPDSYREEQIKTININR